MRLLLVAPPGAGKGTQATKLAARYGIAHLSSGEMLRKEVTARTEIGRIAADYLRRGDLVPDELVIAMLAPAVLEATRSGGYVLDGFPRTLNQAQEAYRVSKQVEGIELQAVLHLVVSRRELHRRFEARAAKEGRNDDTEATFMHRLEVFDSQTEPLLGFYSERGLVVDIDGEQPVDKVFADVVTAVQPLVSEVPGGAPALDSLPPSSR
ncbi:MAG: adenylate kinase [Acidimicrobiales bacterium]